MCEVFPLCDRLYSTARKLLAWNFVSLSNTEEFQQIDKDILIKILTDSGLNVDSEIQVVEAVLGWLNVNMSQHLDTVLDVLQCIYIENLTIDELKTLEEEELFKSDLEMLRKWISSKQEIAEKVYIVIKINIIIIK